MEAAPGVLPPGLLPVRRLLMLGRPSFHVALHIRVGHQVDVAVTVALEANEHHAWRDGGNATIPVQTSWLHRKVDRSSVSLMGDTREAFKQVNVLWEAGRF